MMKGKRIIGLGARRIVFDLDNGFVLKIAKSKYGIISNRKEVMIYKSSPYHIKKNLGYIQKYGHGYSWLIMKKYGKNLPKSKKYSRKLFKLRTKFNQNNLAPYEIYLKSSKPNYGNLRLKQNGEIVVIDYGNFKKLYR